MLSPIPTLLALLAGLAAATAPPKTLGARMVWSDEFRGDAGGSVDAGQWNVMDAVRTNNEVQLYTTSARNLQLSGGQTVQFVPRRTPEGQWTSGRIETKDAWTPAEGQVTQIAASLRMGGNAAAEKQGLWPAFWALGDAMRHGTQWPAAGEIDIFEQVSGRPQAYGTVHCAAADEDGNPCNEPAGRAVPTAMPPDGVFSTYAVKIDRTPADWAAQSITWEINGRPFSVLHGADIGVESTWKALAHSPLYIVLNLAVGGDWPGPPNDATKDGFGSMMEVEWVGVWCT